MTLTQAEPTIAQDPPRQLAHAFVDHQWDATRPGALHVVCSCGWRSDSIPNTLPTILAAWTEHLTGNGTPMTGHPAA